VDQFISKDTTIERLSLNNHLVVNINKNSCFSRVRNYMGGNNPQVAPHKKALKYQ